ncbi:MAG TPA: hypothetical protein VF746_05250 [Longimicrobium sp.]|jgi:hypothetical protein
MNVMKQIVEKMQKIELRMSEKHGPFTLFALFLREDAGISWDVVFSAPWADSDEWEASKQLLEEIGKEITPEERRYIYRTMVIPTDFEDLEELYEEHPVEHGKVIVRNREFGLQFIEKGYIITCRPPVAKAA